MQSYEEKAFSRYCLCSEHLVQNHVFVTIISCESTLTQRSISRQ